MKRLTQWLGSGRLGPSTVKFLSGSMGAQFLVLVSAPFLTRLYSPGDFGAFGVVVSIVAVASVLATLRYEMAIVHAAEESSLRHVFWGTMGLVTAVGLLLAGVSAALPWLPRSWIPNAALLDVAWLVPLVLVVQTWSQVVTRLASTENLYGRMAASMIGGRAVDLVLKIGLASSLGWIGLVLGMVAGDAFTILVLVPIVRRMVSYPPLEWKRYKDEFIRYRDFPLYNLPGAACSALIGGLPIFVMTGIYGSITAGALEMANRVLGRPSSMVGNQFYTVFYQQSVQMLHRKGTIAPLVERLLPLFLLVFAPPFALVAMFGVPLFTFAFGAEWAQAGSYAAILAPAWYLRSVAGPIRVFNTMQRQSLAFYWQFALMLVVALSLVVGCLIGDARTCLAFVSAGTTIAYLGHLALTMQLSGASYRKVAWGLLAPATITIAGVRKAATWRRRRDEAEQPSAAPEWLERPAA